MKVSKRQSIYPLCVILFLLIGGNAFGSEDISSDLLPVDLVIEEVFKPGLGGPVGRVDVVEGEVVIIHAGQSSGYLAKKDLPLFTGDTIVSLETGRIRFILNDGSSLTLASETKLVINRSVFDPAKKSRSSYVSMSLGKARFWVTKLADFKRSMFNVKTPTATCGVRGSDFISFVNANRTETTALTNTQLELRRLAFPEKQPISITDNVYCPQCGFERAVVEEGVLWKEIVPPEEVEEMKRLFEIFQLDGPEEEELMLAEMEGLFSDIVHQVHEDRMKAP